MMSLARPSRGVPRGRQPAPSIGKVSLSTASYSFSTTFQCHNVSTKKADADDAPHDHPRTHRATSSLERTRMKLPGGTQSDHGQAPDLVETTRRHYLDELVDVYVSWREACGEVSAAYTNWQGAGRHDQKLAFSEYIAALNCEEEAATLYQHAVGRLAAVNPPAAPAIPVQAPDARP
jgi:hypothetical protein